jgi:pimeloyl-ACP methyl ester carboxylesterase
MWGDADRLIPVEQAAEWAALVPNASVQTFPGVGHLMFDEDPGVVAAIAEFVRAPVSAPAD